jgi:hypothetical protein
VPTDIKAAHRELTGKVMGREGVTGTAIGAQGGAPCLKVYVTDAKAGRTIPSKAGGFPVIVEVSGAFRRL